MTTYQEFLQSKILTAEHAGYEPDPEAYHPSLKPHQKDAVTWALRLGRALVAMSFGLGKSRIQIEIARQIVAKTGGKFLIVCPLGVKHQFAEEDGPVMETRWQYVRTDAEIKAADTPYLITNYERVRDGGITPALHNITGVSLDEGSVLRSLGSITSDVFKKVFKDIGFRYVCTATPSPNDYKELIYYAEFLGIMDHGQALTRFFKRDSSKAGNLTLMPSQEEQFWLWVASWALFVSRPSDLGYSDAGYDLPELRIHWHRIPVDHSRAFEQMDDRGQRRLILDASGGVSQASAEKRETLNARVEKTMEIVLQYFCKQTSISEGGNENAARSKSGILSGEQGEGESSLPCALSRDQGHDRPGKEERVHEGVSQNVQAETDHTGEARRDQPETPGTLRYRSGVPGAGKTERESKKPAQSASEEERSPESGVRDNPGRVQCSAGEAGRSMCDLRNEDDRGRGEGQAGTFTVCGPRSQNGSGSGNSLQPVQLRDRPFSGRPGTSGEGRPVSDQLVVWCNLNIEQRAIETALSKHGFSVSSIFGSLSIDESERRLYEWKDRKTEIMLGKPSMLGSGLNLQQAHVAVFVGVEYKFEDTIQAVHRLYRFMQDQPVDVHFIFAESEDAVVDVLKRKWQKHNELVANMQRIIKQYGLTETAIEAGLSRKMGVKRVEVKGKFYTAVNNDSVEEIRRLPDNSIGLWCSSYPFGNHYEFSAQYEDFGHNPSNADFWRQMDYLIPEMLRTLKPGRLAAIHVKDRQLYGHQTKSGIMETDPFSDECVSAMRKHGFTYQGRRTIVTDVVRENNATYRLGYSEMCKDASKMSSGLNEYLLLFRKPPTSRDNARADEPVTKEKVHRVPICPNCGYQTIPTDTVAETTWDDEDQDEREIDGLALCPGCGERVKFENTLSEGYSLSRWQIDASGLWRVGANRPLTPEEMAQLIPEQAAEIFKKEQLEHPYDYERHVAICEALEKKGKLPKFFMLLPPKVTRGETDMVWDDIIYMRTLNTIQAQKRKETHICPFPFDIPDRAIRLYSNAGDVVGDPFGGLGTTARSAILQGREAWICELNSEYFVDLTHYCQAAEQQVSMPTLFDLINFQQSEALPAD